MTDALTHAYTVRQPFAYATAVGWKLIENKTERPPLALIGKLVGIHAGLQWARESDLPSWPLTLHSMPRPDNPGLIYGALIGVARLVGVVHVRAGLYRVMRGNSVDVTLVDQTLVARIRPWWRGPWGWLLEEAVLLPEPIPMRGQQGLWRITGGTSDGNGMNATWALEQWRKARETR